MLYHLFENDFFVSWLLLVWKETKYIYARMQACVYIKKKKKGAIMQRP